MPGQRGLIIAIAITTVVLLALLVGLVIAVVNNPASNTDVSAGNTNTTQVDESLHDPTDDPDPTEKSNAEGDDSTTAPDEVTEQTDDVTAVTADDSSGETVQKPTVAPNQVTTVEPTEAPTKAPTVEPTQAPTEIPTEKPTDAPNVPNWSGNGDPIVLPDIDF